MSFYSSTLVGVQPIPVEIEIDLSSGLPFFQIVGLPDAILRESKTRVKSAIQQAGFDFPADQRLVLNLAPSKVRKEGSGFELGMAARILAASNQIGIPEFNVLFLGELALDGSVRPVPESEALSYAAHSDFSKVPFELVAVSRSDVEAVSHLGLPTVAINHLSELKGELWWEKKMTNQIPSPRPTQNNFESLKFSRFWAHHLLIAALGRHHYFLCGPPGTGKTFFAESLHKLLSTLEERPTAEQRLLNVILGRPRDAFPWASPHHSASVAGLIGGGRPIQPGAATRAHGGVLFLDELLEFKKESLDAFREPIEKGSVDLYRAGTQVTFPSRFQLVAATNPCRCGQGRGSFGRCTCLPFQKRMYQARMSGPFLDRFDIKLNLEAFDTVEGEVSGTEIMDTLNKIRTTKKSIVWSKKLDEHLDLETRRGALSRRSLLRARSVAETLSLLDQAPLSLAHVEAAMVYQKFSVKRRR